MLPLNLPHYEFSVTPGASPKIFDFIRKKYVALTPEEWVRQNFLKFLAEEKKYPPSMILLEQTLKVYKTQKRCDVVVYDNTGKPLMILEFKSPEVSINQKVFDQIARYNIALHVRYLIISNGLKHFFFIMDQDKKTFSFQEDIPEYPAL
ncbi:MAG TPA: type I restriction enzyme HsdR N-terminal domain-containing protein [Bacteroidales bacterium]|nr:type I restriction enzyme HsdR N-terminal domain-containing protein [Bacteroidales bacterium]HQI71036.1 type I restriction enzyme HsdR N-terminal domain-containing protein [Bacteroidales bacterium]